MKCTSFLLPIGLCWLFTSHAFALDPQLEKLQATQKRLQAHREEYLKNNGGGPEQTIFKHQLRDWIESQLAALDEKGDVQALQGTINNSIKDSGLIFAGNDETSEFIGYLDSVQLKKDGDLIILTTGVGIVCTYDESAYAYEWKDNRWIRIWQSEQMDYEKEKYLFQHFQSIHYWRPYDFDIQKSADWRIILTLGYECWCSSNWHNVYWRLWRVDSSGMKLMLDKAQWAFEPYNLMGGFSHDSREPGQAFFEFKTASIDDGVHNRQAIYHYIVDKDAIRRTDPVALSPRNFVEEWLKGSQKDVAAWSNSNLLLKLHTQVKSAGGEFDPTMHCKTPDLWQVTLNTIVDKKDYNKTSPLYFLVRWRPPYHFTMMDVRSKPWSLCHQKDEQADEWRTLFPTEMD